MLQAQDKVGRWCDAKVIGIQGKGAKRTYNVHFSRWKARFNEWVPAARLRSCDAPRPEVEPTFVWGRADGWVEADVWHAEYNVR